MVTGRTVRRFRLTVKSIVSSTPSTALASLIETARGTAFLILPTPFRSVNVAPSMFESHRLNFSSVSAIASSKIGTASVFWVSPGWNGEFPAQILVVDVFGCWRTLVLISTFRSSS